MAQASLTAPSKANQRVPLRWYIGVAVAVLLFLLLKWFDNSTELTPNHDGVLGTCFVVAGLTGLLCAGLAIRTSKGMTAVRRIELALAVGVVVSLVLCLVSGYVADIVEGVIDFPPGHTTSYPSLLLISRAYRTGGRNPSWDIQTTPLGSDLDITAQDYDFMLAHRRPGDEGRNPDEISSQGYFCARVTLERSGDALRVMHAGTHTLPEGTVIICPSSRR